MERAKLRYGRETGKARRLRIRTGTAVGVLLLTGCGLDNDGVFVDCQKYPEGDASTVIDLQDSGSLVMGDGGSEEISAARTLITIDVVNVDQSGMGRVVVNAGNAYSYEDFGQGPTEVFRGVNNGHTLTAVAQPTNNQLTSAPVRLTYYCNPSG